jgi:hypothetical protein
MKFLSIHRAAALPLLLCSLIAAPIAMSAQTGDMNGPPKVLVIQREFLKPGRAGTIHEKSESAFIRAMTAAKSTSHYFALQSMSGPARALYFSGYPSFEAWEADNKYISKNATLSAALDHAALADGDLLAEYDQSVLALRDDMSLNTGNLLGKRYMEISRFVVHPGHMKQWEELVKLYTDGYKSIPNANWATFEMVYGVDSGSVFIVISTLKSLSETDSNMADSKKFEEAMGPDGMKKLEELSASCLSSAQTNLFEINPKQSYPPDSWVKAEPDFWKPKVVAPAMKPAASPAP